MIPKRISQIWIGPHAAPVEWMATWRDAHPDWEYRLWDEAAIRELLVDTTTFDQLMRERLYDGAADVARVEILLQHGGVYVDADSECLRPLDDAPFLGAGFFAPIEETTSWRGRLVTNAFMGAVPGHPVLIRYRDELAKLKRHTPTWKMSGPVLLTKILETPYPDVEIVPCWAFYDHTLQGAEVTGGEHYARHLWGTTNHLTGDGGISILVAFREDSRGQRTRLWEFIRAKLELEFPDGELIVGENGDMPFNKSKALNAAAAAASHDVLLITDSDTWTLAADIRHGAELVASGEAPWVKPWRQKTKLCEADTEEILAFGIGWDGKVTTAQQKRAEMRTPWWSSPPCILTKASFESVNGLDERFAGWGQEDDAFGHALECLVGHRVDVGGRDDSVHLWHPRYGKSGFDAWEGSELGQNRIRGSEYRRAIRNRRLMNQLIAGNRAPIADRAIPEPLEA